MTPTLQALTFVLLLGWPAYNIVIALISLRPTRGPARASESGTLHFWIMIPALNEAKVVANTVMAALALEAPGSPVQVMVIDDASDDETPQILASISDPRLHVLRRELPIARRGKGEALNSGFRAIRAMAEESGTSGSTIVGVVDGDGRGERSLLHRVGELFSDRRVGAVQCRVRINNRSRVLGLLQDIEFACIANASQSLRDRLGSVGMGGNGQFVRLSDLARLGDSPWSGCLVEDLELGLKLHLAGVGIRYTSVASMSQQAVVDPVRLLRQRTRWAQGNLQCARYVRPLASSRSVGTVGLVDFLYYLLAPWLTIPLTLLVGVAVTFALVSLSTGETFGGLMAGRTAIELAIGVWIGVLFAPGLIWGAFYWRTIGAEPLRRCMLAGLCYPAFLVVGVMATWRAVVRHATSQGTWAKTERLDDQLTAAVGATLGPPSHDATLTTEGGAITRG